jgi:hypothetical protein
MRKDKQPEGLTSGFPSETVDFAKAGAVPRQPKAEFSREPI